MFTIDEGIQDLKVKDRNIYKILYSMNSPQVATPELSVEEARCYVLFFSEGPNISAYIGLYLPRTNRKIFYVYSSNPFPFEALKDVETEATSFAEDMGFLLDEISVSGMPVEDRNRWIEEQYIFGYRQPEVTAEQDEREEEREEEEEEEAEEVEGEEGSGASSFEVQKKATEEVPPAAEEWDIPSPATAEPVTAATPEPASPAGPQAVPSTPAASPYQANPAAPVPQATPAPSPPVQQPPQIYPPFQQPVPQQGQQVPPVASGPPVYPPQPQYPPQQNGSPYGQPYGQPQQQPNGQPPQFPQQPYGQQPQPYPQYPPQAPPQGQPVQPYYPQQPPGYPPQPPDQRLRQQPPSPPKAAVKKKVPHQRPAPEPEVELEESREIDVQIEPARQRPRNVYEEAMKEGVVRPPKAKTARTARSASGQVSRDKEALARLLASF